MILPCDFNEQLVILSDSARVGVRYTSGSGGPAIDAKYPNGTKEKVHVRRWPPAQ